MFSIRSIALPSSASSSARSRFARRDTGIRISANSSAMKSRIPATSTRSRARTRSVLRGEVGGDDVDLAPPRGGRLVVVLVERADHRDQRLPQGPAAAARPGGGVDAALGAEAVAGLARHERP